MRSLSRRASRFAEHSAQANMDAAVTISARTLGFMSPDAKTAPEAARMMEEKIAAACEGAAGASLAWGAFLFASALRGGATLSQMSHALFDVAEAAAAPAQRAVSANARRFKVSAKST